MKATLKLLLAVLIITTLHVPLGDTSPRLPLPNLHPPDPPCAAPDPTTLRPDQLTVLISGYSEHRIPLLHTIAASYSAAPSVAAVIVLWCNPSTPPQTLSQLSRNLTLIRAPSSSLNHRFRPWEIIKTRAVLICDDDVEPDPTAVSFAFRTWRADPDRVVGLFARSHAYDIRSRTWIYTMEREKYSIVLTKFMILKLEYLRLYSCGGEYAPARRVVEETNNCEDILMNFVVADVAGKGPVLVGGMVRDYGDARNDGVLEVTVRDVGLSSRKEEHRRRRGECIREFHRVLGKMPLRYSYGKVVDDVGEQGLCEKGGKIVLCDHQDLR